MTPGLSIIIVTYRSRDEISDCLRSIPRELFGKPVQVMIVENDSGDGIERIVQSEFPWVEFIYAGGNLGFSKANNMGFERAHGEFILFLNPDTVVNREALEHCLQRLMDDETIGVISPKLVMKNGEMDLACRRSIPTVWDGFTRASGLARWFPKVKLFAGYNLTYLPENESHEVGAVNGAFMMIPLRVWKHVGGWDERFFMYGEDLDWCHRCRQSGFKVIYDGRHSIIHIKGQSSSKEYQQMSKEMFCSMQKFYMKHFNPKNSVWIRWKYGFFLWLWSFVSGVRGFLRGHRKARPI